MKSDRGLVSKDNRNLKKIYLCQYYYRYHVPRAAASRAARGTRSNPSSAAVRSSAAPSGGKCYVAPAPATQNSGYSAVPATQNGFTSDVKLVTTVIFFIFYTLLVCLRLA